MAKLNLDNPVLDYTIVYNCITKLGTKATYSFKRFKPYNDTARKWNKASEKAETKFLGLANKCGWIITSDIIKNGEK